MQAITNMPEVTLECQQNSQQEIEILILEALKCISQDQAVYLHDILRQVDYLNIQKISLDNFSENVVSLYKKNQLYSNSEFTKFTSFPHPQFTKFEEMMSKIHPEFQIQDNILQIHSEGVEYKMVKRVLLSPADNPDLHSFASLIKRGPFFLQSSSENPSIGLISFPRSGNSMLRKMLEFTTGMITGSGATLSRPPVIQLLHGGFRGDGNMSHQILIKKSHLPIFFKGPQTIEANKLVICYRNPKEVIPSLFNLVLTESHNCKLPISFYQEQHEAWDKFIKDTCEIYVKWFKFWLNEAVNSIYPVLFVRYEDLVSRKKEQVLRQILEFIFEEKLEGTCLEKNLELSLQNENNYAPYKRQEYSESKLIFSANQLNFINDQTSWITEIFENERWSESELMRRYQLFKNPQKHIILINQSFLMTVNLITNKDEVSLRKKVNIADDITNKSVENLICSALRSVQLKDNKKGVYFFEIKKEIQLHYGNVSPLQVEFVFANYVRNDSIFVHSKGNKFSFYKHGKYDKFSIYLANNSYQSTSMINLEAKIKELLSPAFPFGNKCPPQFLNGSPIDHIALTGFPRSGNSLMRQNLEYFTETITGDHTKKIFVNDLYLEQIGYKGQGIYDSRVWFVKTHFPLGVEKIKCDEFEASTFICTVRNPYDINLSELNVALTHSHNLQVEFKLNEQNIEEYIYTSIVKFQQWTKYYQWWIDFAEQQREVYFVRYEDIVSNPCEVYEELFKSLLHQDLPNDCLLQTKINQFKLEQKANYIPKQQSNFEATLKSMIPQEVIDEKTLKILRFFEYETNKGDDPLQTYNQHNKECAQFFKERINNEKLKIIESDLTQALTDQNFGFIYPNISFNLKKR